MNTALMRIAAVGVCLAVGASVCGGATARNVILMISDGQGFNTVKATDYFVGSPAVYEGIDFVRYGVQTSSANNAGGYDPAQMWASFNYQKSGATDSAAAATAMYTGQKVYDGRINMDVNGDPLTTYFEHAASAGKSIGAVSSVEITHATPAAVYGHNVSRSNYAQIGTEGIYGSNPTANNGFYDSSNYHDNMVVLMGAGHGDYNNNGVYDVSRTNKYAGGDATWADITDGSAPNGWTFVEAKADFDNIANGVGVPNKLLGIAQVNTTLQQARSNPGGNFDPLNTNVPSLATMTKAALNVLGQDSDGFTVMIEGGAVDWASHANQLDRMIEEQTDFNSSVQAAVDWVEANSSWDQTLLIVTADHETGGLWGASGSFTPIGDNGPGNLPAAVYNSGSHTNQLVPLYARGAGSELFADHIVGTDDIATHYGATGFTDDHAFVDNTSIFNVMAQASSVAVPEPGSIALLALVGMAVTMRRCAIC